jgi:hypothetical protein
MSDEEARVTRLRVVLVAVAVGGLRIEPPQRSQGRARAATETT